VHLWHLARSRANLGGAGSNPTLSTDSAIVVCASAIVE
jgi:hypothetical protein